MNTHHYSIPHLDPTDISGCLLSRSRSRSPRQERDRERDHHRRRERSPSASSSSSRSSRSSESGSETESKEERERRRRKREKKEKRRKEVSGVFSELCGNRVPHTEARCSRTVLLTLHYVLTGETSEEGAQAREEGEKGVYSYQGCLRKSFLTNLSRNTEAEKDFSRNFAVGYIRDHRRIRVRSHMRTNLYVNLANFAVF